MSIEMNRRSLCETSLADERQVWQHRRKANAPCVIGRHFAKGGVAERGVVSFLLAWTLALCLAWPANSLASPLGSGQRQHDRPPNLVFIMVDDLGKEWVSCYGAEGIETPQLDQLAQGGMRFENAYSMPQCTPSRVTLLTGLYPFHHGWTNHFDVPRWGSGCHFDPSMNASFPKLLQKLGYRTAIAGKWQIDDFRVEPQALAEAGFDEWCVWTGGEGGNPASNSRYWDPYVFEGAKSETRSGDFGPDVYSDFLVKFIGEHQDEPMFLYFPMTLTHGPLVATPDERQATEKIEKHTAMVRHTDKLIGKIVAALQEHELLGETIIIVTTDNGTDRGITGMRNGHEVQGAKSQMTEAGTAMPFIAFGPGIVPAGRVTDALVDFTDLFPTFVELAGGELDADTQVDGHSFAPLLLGHAEDSPRDWILSQGGGPATFRDNRTVPVHAYDDRVIRDKRWKLWINTDRAASALYDLQRDPWEENNLIESDVPEVKAARDRLQEIAKAFPERDAAPRYQPNPSQTWDRFDFKNADNSAASSADHPNIILVMADDLGWGDTGYYGHPHLRTPNLDEMASEGIRFDRFYAGAPVCSPTRGSCLTGRHPYRYGIPFANSGHLLDREQSLAEQLKTVGYRTGHFGKWHLGTLTTKINDSNRGRPGNTSHYAPPWEHGFDVCCSTEAKTPTWWDEGEYEAYGTHYWTGPEQQLAPADVIGDDSKVIMDHALEFIHEANQNEQPFFAVVWFHTPHRPIKAGPEYKQRYAQLSAQEAEYYGCITAMDEQLGRLRAFLTELDCDQNTLIWFCSDNGPENNTPGTTSAILDVERHTPIQLKGRKRSLHEGGIRVPGILVWPARVDAQQIVSMPCVTSDFLPTVLEIAGIHRDAKDSRTLDGISLLPVIEGKQQERKQPIGFMSRDQAAFVAQRFKIYRRGEQNWELYDLIEDPGETNDLRESRPDELQSLVNKFETWKESVDAETPRNDLK